MPHKNPQPDHTPMPYDQLPLLTPGDIVLHQPTNLRAIIAAKPRLTRRGYAVTAKAGKTRYTILERNCTQWTLL